MVSGDGGPSTAGSRRPLILSESAREWPGELGRSKVADEFDRPRPSEYFDFFSDLRRVSRSTVYAGSSETAHIFMATAYYLPPSVHTGSSFTLSNPLLVPPGRQTANRGQDLRVTNGRRGGLVTPANQSSRSGVQSSDYALLAYRSATAEDPTASRKGMRVELQTMQYNPVRGIVQRLFLLSG